MATERLLTPGELSRWLGVSVRSIYLLCRKHAMPHYHVGKSLRFSKAEIMEWLQTHPHSGSSGTGQTDVEQLKLFE